MKLPKQLAGTQKPDAIVSAEQRAQSKALANERLLKVSKVLKETATIPPSILRNVVFAVKQKTRKEKTQTIAGANRQNVWCNINLINEKSMTHKRNIFSSLKLWKEASNG